MGNEIRGSKYWEGEENRRCRMCGGEEETWEHVWENCRRGRKEKGSWQEAVEWVLGEEGLGEGWMRELKEEKEGWGEGRGWGEGSEEERKE